MKFINTPPDWKAGGIEPPIELKEHGFQAGYRPPAEYFNWFWCSTGKCLAEIQELMIAFYDTKANLDEDGKLAKSEIPNIDCGIWDDTVTDPIVMHNYTASAHVNMIIDGNAAEVADTSATLEEHIKNPVAHQNLIVDGNEN